jgi:hypothetical protein
MKAQEITKAKVEAYLKEKGIEVSQLFGEASERLDPIDRHLALRDLYYTMTGYKMEKEGLTLELSDPQKVKIVHPNMRDFDEIRTLDDCVTNLKFLAYGKEASLSHAKEKRSREEKKPIERSSLDQYFHKEHGKTLEELFDMDSYYRYTKEGADILLAGIEYYTGWKMGKIGLQLQDPNEPRAFVAHPKVESMNDIKSAQEYLDKINQLREERDLHYQILEEGKKLVHEREKEETLEEEVADFLKERGWNFEMLFDAKRSAKQRKERMNEIFKHFAKSYVNKENNVVILNPVGEEYQVTKTGDIKLGEIKNKEHFIHVVQGFKQNRDLSFFIASPFVRERREITVNAVEEVAQEKLGFSFEDAVEGKGMTKKERSKHLDALHFYLTESHQDKDKDIVVSHPRDEKQFVSFKNIENKEQYYDSIESIDDFMEKVISARKQRDMLHQTMNRLKQLPNRDQKKIVEILREDDEPER